MFVYNDRHDLTSTNPSRWIVTADVLSRIAQTLRVCPTGSRYSAAPFRSLAAYGDTSPVHWRSQEPAPCGMLTHSIPR